MKTLMAMVLGLLLSQAVLAADVKPLSPGKILGVQNGVYIGDGSLNFFVSFTSTRSLRGDVISVTTEARALGVPAKTVSARLQVVPTGAQTFDMIDLGLNKVTGKGSCEAIKCSFDVTVDNGGLRLKETWIADESGFSIVEGWQDLGGWVTTYESRLLLQDY